MGPETGPQPIGNQQSWAKISIFQPAVSGCCRLKAVAGEVIAKFTVTQA